MNESALSNAGFIESTRTGTIVGRDIEQKQRKKRAEETFRVRNEESEEDDTLKSSKKKETHEDSWFVDAEDDEELMDTMLSKHGFNRPKTDAILLCPGCFTTLCNQCQQHEVYPDQYRALIVTSGVRVSNTDIRKCPDSSDPSKTIPYWTVFCRECNVEVGVYDPNLEVYHFHDVLPGR